MCTRPGKEYIKVASIQKRKTAKGTSYNVVYYYID